MVIRAMSSGPSRTSELPRINKFVGEGYELANVRTIYAGGADDIKKRDHRVIVLIGPKTSGKADLIDFFCSYFYGASVENEKRYHIANEQFNESSPQKLISTYIFNNTQMKHRPIIIDTPCTDNQSGDDDVNFIKSYFTENDRMRIDIIAVVLSSVTRLTTQEESQLQKTLGLLPPHARSNVIVIVTESDGSPPSRPLLRRLELEEAPVYKINTGCLFQPPSNDTLKENLRESQWCMSYASLNELFTYIHLTKPVTISGKDPEKKSFPGSMKDSGSEASSTFSSRQGSFREPFYSGSGTKSPESQIASPPDSSASVQTVITREPTMEKTATTSEQIIKDGRQITITTTINERNDKSTTETTKRYPPILSSEIREVVPPSPPSSSLPARPPQLPPAPPFPPPLPPSSKSTIIPSESVSKTGVPTNLLEEIRNSSRAIGKETPLMEMKDVIVVDYKDADPEVVILNHSPQTQTANHSVTETVSKRYSQHELRPHPIDHTPPKTPDFPPPMTPISRPYDLPPSGAKPRRPPITSGSSTIGIGVKPSGIIPVSPANKDTIRVYSDETTPPPPSSTIPITKNVSSTYSTLVFMNDNGTYTTDNLKTYTPSNTTKNVDRYPTTSQLNRTSPTSPYSTSLTSQLKDKKDNSQKLPDYQTLPYSAMITNSDSLPRHSYHKTEYEKESLERGYSLRKDMPMSSYTDTNPIRYVYETASRNYVPYAIGQRSHSRQGREFERRKRESRSLEPMRTSQPEEEPFYSASGVIQVRQRSPNRRSATSLNRLSGGIPELIHSEDKYSYLDRGRPTSKVPKETLIDYRSPISSRPEYAMYDPYKENQRPYESDNRNGNGKPTNVPSYSINPNRNSNALLLERDKMLKKTREDVNRDSYPYPVSKTPIYQNVPIQNGGQPNQYDVVPSQQGYPDRNDVMIPIELRNGQPFQINVDMKGKNTPQVDNEPHLPAHGYKDTDYGDNWDSGHRPHTAEQKQMRPGSQQQVQPMQPSQNQPQAQPYQQQQQQQMMMERQQQHQELQRNRPENLNIGSGAVPNGAANNGRHGYGVVQDGGVRITETTHRTGGFLTEMNDPRSPAPPPYATRPYPGYPDDRGMRQNQVERQPLRPGKNTRNQRKSPKRKPTKAPQKATKVTTRKRTPRRAQIQCLNWSPKECGNPRDCCLNFVFFLIIPLIILAIIAVIIIIILSNRSDDYDNNYYRGNNYNSYGANYNSRYQF